MLVFCRKVGEKIVAPGSACANRRMGLHLKDPAPILTVN